MKLYALNIGYDFGLIEECEVVKETPKTFVIKIGRRNWEQRIYKSEMATRTQLIFKTHEETQEGLKKELLRRINMAKETIKKRNEDIQKYNSMLDDLEKGGATQ